ncbi:hypothetical protein L596_024022 [Steinernema carpocapsae]|uniref:Protein kinase domain-containing protein n=1 Tax=Steinernema carpocapsae TaxID=34508 RepID=A0A4U5MFH3_STECR|nr:hypothetical protein L596_024022 [Steinernema carpocapsae]
MSSDPRALSAPEMKLNHYDARDVHYDRKRIGRGSFGQVYVATLGTDPTPVAVKEMKPKPNKSEEDVHQEMIREANLMCRLNGHENVVDIRGVVDRPMLIVMGLCRDGSLDHVLRHAGASISTRTRIGFSIQAARGLEWLHSKGIIHRDLATRNCLLSGDVLKLCDFGMSRTTADPFIDSNIPQNIRWMAPELWYTEKVTFASDMYSFSVLLWELFAIPPRRPWTEYHGYQVKHLVMEGHRLTRPPAMPESVRIFMTLCHATDPFLRPSAADGIGALTMIMQESDYDSESCAKEYEDIRATELNDLKIARMRAEAERMKRRVKRG